MAPNIPVSIVFTTVLAVVSTGLIAYVVRKNKRKCVIPTKWKQIGNAEKLYIFPSKSGRFMKIDTVECTEVGFRSMKTEENPLQLRDRSFMVYGENDKKIRSGRAIPSLVKIELAVADANHIALNAPNMEKILVKVPRRNDSQKTFVSDWTGEKIETLDCGDEIARWLSQQISQQDSGYRLGFHDGSKRRKFIKLMKGHSFYENLSDASTGLFSDSTSIMIVNQASVNDCASKISSDEITHLYFRGNIVVSGPDVKPYDEDNWDWIKVGDVILRNVKECTRCAFTNVDPEKGQRSVQKEPIKTSSSYRMGKGPENAPVMGIHAEVRAKGFVKSGDPVYVGFD